MILIRSIWNVIVIFLFAAFLCVVALIATQNFSLATISFWIGLIIGMVAIQIDLQQQRT